MEENYNDLKPIGICNRTNTYVYETEVEGYSAYCPELDEDLYLFEFTPLDEMGSDRVNDKRTINNNNLNNRIMRVEPFSEERRYIREEWNKIGGMCWYDFLYLFSGRAENSAGEVYAL